MRQGAVAQVQPAPLPQTAGLTWGRRLPEERTDRRTWKCQRPCPLPPARHPARDSPPPPLRPPAAGGRFPPLPATLCRRSPAPGMGAAAVGPLAGFRARVGERGALAPPTPGTCGRGVVAVSAPAA